MLCLLKTAYGVMTIYGKQLPSELSAQFSAGILSNVPLSKKKTNKFNACDFFPSLSAVCQFSKSSLLMPFSLTMMHLHISQKY